MSTWFICITAPGDYTPVNLTITRELLEGNGYQVSIPVLDDDILEREERFLGRLLLTTESLELTVINLAQSLAEVNIIDNDCKTMSYSKNTSVYSYITDMGKHALHLVSCIQ